MIFFTNCISRSQTIRMKYLLATILLVIFSCKSKEKQVDSSVDTTASDSIKKYNPPVDTTYFYPADSSEIIKTVQVTGYTVTTTILPIEHLYHNYFLDHSKNGKARMDKIRRRDYKLKIDITDNNGFQKTELVNRELFRNIITDSDFITSAKFVGLDGEEFKFELTFSFLDDTKPSFKIKFFLPKNDKPRFVNFPESYYDSLYPSPD